MCLLEIGNPLRVVYMVYQLQDDEHHIYNPPSQGYEHSDCQYKFPHYQYIYIGQKATYKFYWLETNPYTRFFFLPN